MRSRRTPGWRGAVLCVPIVFATYIPTCAPAMRATVTPGDAQRLMPQLWQEPPDFASGDFFDGPWGASHAPKPRVPYTFVKPKTHGVSPGMTVKDPEGREWSVKEGPEGPIEVVLSRVLSGVGYHQPPVYYLPKFLLDDGSGPREVEGGRFRLHEPSLKDLGEWAFQQNPFVGSQPFEGLLVILMMFNSSDLKNSNNTLYAAEHKPGEPDQWYVVRDLGTALGETGRLNPKRGDVAIFERHAFITGVRGGHVKFSYHGWHKELFAPITPDQVQWASRLMARISDRQWADAFRAGGYAPAEATRFIRRLHEKIEQGAAVGR